MPGVGASPGRGVQHDIADRPLLTAEWLRRRYVEQRRSAQDITTGTGWSSQYVRDRLRDHDIPLRPAGASPNLAPVDPAGLADWSAQGLSPAQIAARTGYSPSGVRKLLRRAGLPTRAAVPAKSRPDPSGDCRRGAPLPGRGTEPGGCRRRVRPRSGLGKSPRPRRRADHPPRRHTPHRAGQSSGSAAGGSTTA
jgi:hypothetical protein